jgi:hypothetical protein
MKKTSKVRLLRRVKAEVTESREILKCGDAIDVAK